MPSVTPLPPNIAPPEESTWRRYSPRNEMPFAGTASLILHGLILGILVFCGMALNHRWHDQTSQPPKTDVVFVEATLGDGLPPGGGSPPGSAQGTETVEPKDTPKFVIGPITPPIEPITPKLDFKIEIPNIAIDINSPDINKVIDNITKDIKDTQKLSIQYGNTTVAKEGGRGGGGLGTVKGPGEGPGIGTGGLPGGKPASRAEILAQRWCFSPTGSPKEHVNKLNAIGITLGFQDGNNMFYVIEDLSRRPVKFKQENFDKYKDTVKWYSQDPRSVVGLSLELRMPGPPKQFVLLLPKEREQKMGDAERQFAQSRGRDLKMVQETWFDFRLKGGAYEPSVIGQFPFEPRPKW